MTIGSIAPIPARAMLSRTERSALALAEWVNQRPASRQLSLSWNTLVMRRLVDLLCAGRLAVLGSRYLEHLPHDRGVLLAPNHRSLFDLFVVASAAYTHLPPCRRLSFPVRSGFWYDTVPGFALNAVFTGCAMYPPMFRPAAKRAVTRASLDLLAADLRRPGTLSGMHPEGTRGKGADRYALLPPEPSFGRLVLMARPHVVPVFVSGLGNSLLREVWGVATRSAEPIRVSFGEPIELPAADRVDSERLRAQVEVSRQTLAAISVLARADRALALQSGGSEPATSATSEAFAQQPARHIERR